jgi:hypothetical protein
LTDNGAGSKANSPDFMLYLNHYKVDFKTNKFTRLGTIFLHDPDKKVPFRIVHESTDKRYLTGADFDPEAFQFAGGFLWIGEEFGPYIIKADLNGFCELGIARKQIDFKPLWKNERFTLIFWVDINRKRCILLRKANALNQEKSNCECT